MTDRVQKSRSRTAVQRSTLAALINESGVEIMPCTGCFHAKRVCRMNENSSRCGECVRRGRSCDGVSVVSARRCSFFLFFFIFLSVSYLQ